MFLQDHKVQTQKAIHLSDPNRINPIMKQHEETTHQSSLNYQALDKEYKSSYLLLFIRDTTQRLIFAQYRLCVQLARHKGGYKKTTQRAAGMQLKQRCTSCSGEAIFLQDTLQFPLKFNIIFIFNYISSSTVLKCKFEVLDLSNDPRGKFTSYPAVFKVIKISPTFTSSDI